MTLDQLKKFLIELKTNKTLLNEVSSVATANEIALIYFITDLKILAKN